MNQPLDLAKLRLARQRVFTSLARRCTLEFCRYTKEDWITAEHHKLLCSLADAVLDGRLKRLIVSLPPRHTKSEIFSIRLPALYLGRNPDKQIIHVSYASALSNEFSRQVRILLRDASAYRRLFPNLQLDPERQRLDDWKTSAGGGFKSMGVGGGLTGHGADLLIIDDPVKEGDEQSVTTLDQIFTWYSSAARTRLSPGAAVIIVMTRWHPGDLVGRLLDLQRENEDADQWHVVNLPALALEDDALGRAPGQALWPERFDEKALHAIRSLDPRYFEALFQQDPQPDVNKLFNAADFQLVESIEHSGRCAWAFDLAISEKDAGDFTVFGRGSYDRASGALHISDVQRLQQEWPLTKRLIHELLRQYPEDEFVFPKQTFELMAVQELKREMPGAAHRIKHVSFSARSDKRSRAAVLADRAASHRVFVEDTPAGRHLVQEHDRFPDRYDDCVDFSSVLTHYFGLHDEFDALVARGEEAPDLRQQLVEREHDLLKRMAYAPH